MIQKWIFSSLWILFMILGITFIRKENIKEVFIEIFGENLRELVEGFVLFDDPLTLIIVSFIPILNIYYLIVYLCLGFCNKNVDFIQTLKEAHQNDMNDRNGTGI